MRVAVAGWIGSTNLGDELVFAALSRKLEERRARVVAVSVDPEQTRRIHEVDAIRAADLVRYPVDRLIFGGGEILQDETSIWNVPYHLSRVWTARARGTKFAVVGVGAVALRSTAAAALVRRSLGRAVAVTARDRRSLTSLRRLRLDPDLSADPALALDAPEGITADRLVLCLRPPLDSGASRMVPVAARNRGRPDDVWLTSLARAVDETCSATGLTPRFVAFQTGRDDVVHRLVAERMEHAPELVSPGVRDILGEIARGAVVVAMRYHGGVGAVATGRPAVLLGYSAKVAALCEDIGPAATLLPVDGTGLAHTVQRMTGLEPLARAARDRLRHRERANDTAIDRLLEG